MNKPPIWEGVFNSFPTVSERPAFEREQWIGKQIIEAEQIAQQAAQPGPFSPNPLAYVLAALSLKAARLIRVADFGGGLGLEYLRLKDHEWGGCNLSFSVIETGEVCNEGRKLFSGAPSIRFYESLDLLGEPHDVFYASNSFQYIRNWKPFIRLISQLDFQMIYLRGVLAGEIPTFASLQNYYGTGIPVWFHNKVELLGQFAEAGYSCLLDAPCSSTYFGMEQPPPMLNFEKHYRLESKRDILLARSLGGSFR